MVRSLTAEARREFAQQELHAHFTIKYDHFVSVVGPCSVKQNEMWMVDAKTENSCVVEGN